MQDFLIIKLQGAMQAWGGHTFEDYRPSHIFPTRSAVVGLLGACLGIDRADIKGRADLNASFEMTVRADRRKVHKEQFGQIKEKILTMQKMTDFHTILDARRVDGSQREDAIISHREYLCDAEFSVALGFRNNAVFNLEKVKAAIQKPHYTPSLGRRSCPIQSPLFKTIISAESAQEALAQIEPMQGTLYSEQKLQGSVPIRIRDIPIEDLIRQFSTRTLYILGDSYVL
ncbi:CRISPR system Cascade subunit CasD [Methanosarcinales archaeon]|uniref:type I-E CRISPR-associated protein Cas5/CasD n=1 Tax=Candidatus Methanoperedens sp. BLZ2 TaxID=2035255 RepID=UPI000BE3D1C4|nr:type I-E CRISPR-associated protein Cas5/CasD [Candidatus Methanoperedens sp. BLZ2]KAB2946079.1 MAG: type I-E CRISPR-associated protein Cas5/CasD [Candidatus Methanoperedens sp.]MCX9076640.1 type I-E CRISPR-associated protein Cas5/CasD [Candidatus Methanoperedens sp.]MCX9089435.1 type I-E CRISPR-associated protein Cas5/CasD [Candidatus Methanoperedens sp.]CAG0956608.1 CRISPR system Cascade subunit CasD [Methanosarcinales archaeon]